MGLRGQSQGDVQAQQNYKAHRAQSENFSHYSTSGEASAAPTEVQNGGVDKNYVAVPPNPLDYRMPASQLSQGQVADEMTSMSGQDYQVSHKRTQLARPSRCLAVHVAAGALTDATPGTQIVRLLGQGTQGKVWEATMTRSGKSVVIKCLHKQHVTDISSTDSAKREQAKLFWRAFRNEIDILEACAGHPNIIKIVGRSPDFSQLMMEKADMDLNQCLKANNRRLTLGQCYKWFQDILVGVAHLHSLGVSFLNTPGPRTLGASSAVIVFQCYCLWPVDDMSARDYFWSLHPG